MAAVAALRTALSALGRNPVLFLGGLLYGILVLPQKALPLAGTSFVPTILRILTFFVTPFVVAGVIGMADEALDGDTSLGTLRAVGTDAYVPLLVGNFVEFAIIAVVSLVLGFVGVAIVLGIFAGVAGVVGLVVGLVAIAILFFVQFYPVLIVLTDADAVGSFTESYGFVRRNLVATLGYSVVQFVVGVAIAVPLRGAFVYRTLRNFDPASTTPGAGAGAGTGAGTAGAAGGFGGLLGSTPVFSTPEVIALSLISVAVTILGMAFQQTYAVSFYRRHAADAPDYFEETSGDEYAVDADDGVSRADDDAEWRYD